MVLICLVYHKSSDKVEVLLGGKVSSWSKHDLVS